MLDLKDKTKCAAGLQQELGDLKDLAAKSTNKYVTALFIALSDEKVRETWEKKIKQEYVPGFVDFEDSMIPEQVVVIFPFECKEGTYCFLNPSFAVTVDWLNQQVVAIIDPYLPGSHHPRTLVRMPIAMQAPQNGVTVLSDGHVPWPGMGGYRKQQNAVN